VRHAKRKRRSQKKKTLRMKYERKRESLFWSPSDSYHDALQDIFIRLINIIKELQRGSTKTWYYLEQGQSLRREIVRAIRITRGGLRARQNLTSSRGAYRGDLRRGGRASGFWTWRKRIEARFWQSSKEGGGISFFRGGGEIKWLAISKRDIFQRSEKLALKTAVSTWGPGEKTDE